MLTSDALVIPLYAAGFVPSLAAAALARGWSMRTFSLASGTATTLLRRLSQDKRVPAQTARFPRDFNAFRTPMQALRQPLIGRRGEV